MVLEYLDWKNMEGSKELCPLFMDMQVKMIIMCNETRY